MWMSEAAEQAGVNVQTIRYYERRGLLPLPRREAAGYRDLQPDTVRRVRFIKRAQDLGFSLDEIAELLELRGDTVRNRSRARGVAERRLQQVERKIAELVAMRDVLRMLVHRCHVSRRRECPILEALEASSGVTP
jgi:MerR family transcriptional regulator, mercuric resistance operon regulatory protein